MLKKKIDAKKTTEPKETSLKFWIWDALCSSIRRTKDVDDIPETGIQRITNKRTSTETRRSDNEYLNSMAGPPQLVA